MALMFGGTIADLHTRGWCTDFKQVGYIKSTPNNNGATKAACAAYKKRNTGTQQWDTCPDCTPQQLANSPDFICLSPLNHIGGDEWNYYCLQAGAYASEAE
ncbi:hypothetical protein BELL_2433g00010 [Botrytis elliptica]|uniref:Uncharacterized protein n=1 Tax=Botrytis elliptica TaxID=278938 RepID=A0A4Z1H776_9HELO|nr:hypothetical protein BELL_2433g00010 [Botrytis elliptica]